MGKWVYYDVANVCIELIHIDCPRVMRIGHQGRFSGRRILCTTRAAFVLYRIATTHRLAYPVLVVRPGTMAPLPYRVLPSYYTLRLCGILHVPPMAPEAQRVSSLTGSPNSRDVGIKYERSPPKLRLFFAASPIPSLVTFLLGARRKERLRSRCLRAQIGILSDAYWLRGSILVSAFPDKPLIYSSFTILAVLLLAPEGLPYEATRRNHQLYVDALITSYVKIGISSSGMQPSYEYHSVPPRYYDHHWRTCL